VEDIVNGLFKNMNMNKVSNNSVRQFLDFKQKKVLELISPCTCFVANNLQTKFPLF